MTKLHGGKGLKSRIRQQILEKRSALRRDEVARLSEEVVLRFYRSLIQSLGSGRQNLAVTSYRALASELDLKALETRFSSLEWQWRFHFPRVVGTAPQRLEFVEINQSIDSSLSWKTGPYGIQEPHPELQAIAPENLDLVFLPGAAFGFQGERIGMGAGYYDRFLPHAKHALRVALVFDFQVLPELPQDSWDQRVDWILTEKREIRTPAVEEWLEKKCRHFHI